jgi:hypothetical protein
VTAPLLEPLGCALFLLAAFALAGCAQAAWLGSAAARRFAWPIDGGCRWRGRRVFGGNKTARGFIVMIPATAAAFFMLSLAAHPGAHGLWRLTPFQYAALGLIAGVGFMAGELPNSFIKRQLDIAPGHGAEGRLARPLFFIVDRVDSVLGALMAIGSVMPVPWPTVAAVLLFGPVMHGLFSVLTFRLGGKERPA